MIKAVLRLPLFSILIALFFMTNQGCDKELPDWEPKVSLRIEPSNGLTTQTYQIKTALENLPVSHKVWYVQWDFEGDSLWDTPFTAVPEISHRFYKKGTYEIRVQVLTEDGKIINLRQEVKVDQGYSAPIAQFKVNPTIGHYLMDFQFDARETFDDEDEFSTLQFRWDFQSDGYWDTDLTSNPMATWRYPAAGKYACRLLVMDPTNRSSIVSREVEVNFRDPGILVDFSWTSDKATLRDTFLLDASITRHESDSSRVFTYSWQIDNEVTYGPFNEPTFSHMFWKEGMQKITLTATDQYRLNNSCTKELYVNKENKPPTPAIFVPSTYGNLTTNFYMHVWNSRDDTDGPTQLIYRWDFEGDGKWDTGWSHDMEIYHQFTSPGSYLVNLQAEDPGGERGIGTLKLLVTPSTNPTGYITDSRDKKYYATIKIGNQWWMAQNLDFRFGGKQGPQLIQKCYNESSAMCDLYGALYQGEYLSYYDQAGKNICPEGWRLPNREDMLELGHFIDLNVGKPDLLPGGSLGLNMIYAGTGTYEIFYDPSKPSVPIDTVFTWKNLGKESSVMSSNSRPFMSEDRSQFRLAFYKETNAVYLDWGGNRKFYHSVRCIKTE